MKKSMLLFLVFCFYGDVFAGESNEPNDPNIIMDAQIEIAGLEGNIEEQEILIEKFKTEHITLKKENKMLQKYYFVAGQKLPNRQRFEPISNQQKWTIIDSNDLSLKIINLKAVSKEQKKYIQNMRDECIALKKENKFIRKCFLDASQKLPDSQQLINSYEHNIEPNNLIICGYHGRIRNDRWVESAYKQYGNQIMMVDCQYVNILEFDKNTPLLYQSVPVPKNQIVKLPEGYKVLNVLGKGELLISRHYGDVVLHLKKLPDITYVDDQSFPAGYFKGNGTYSYIAVVGSEKVITSLIPFSIHAVSKDEFVHALNSGILLYGIEVVNRDGTHPIIP